LLSPTLPRESWQLISSSTVLQRDAGLQKVLASAMSRVAELESTDDKASTQQLSDLRACPPPPPCRHAVLLHT